MNGNLNDLIMNPANGRYEIIEAQVPDSSGRQGPQSFQSLLQQ
ncbi:MAG: hypothetical protein U0176_02770 [Bacteroidia bacterium]